MIILRNNKAEQPNLNVFMLSYDISDDYCLPGKTKVDWKELFSDLAVAGYIDYTTPFVFADMPVYVVRPTKSTWIFHSQKSLNDIHTALQAYQDRGLLWGVCQIKEQDDVMHSVGLCRINSKLQDDMNAGVDAFKKGM